MKKTNRFIAMAAALTLTASAMIPMFAFADDTYTITIIQPSSDKGTHTYEAYQIFSGDYSESGTGTSKEKTLSNIAWGTGIDSTKLSDLYTALKNANIGMDKEDPTSTTTPKARIALSTPKEVADVLGSSSFTTANSQTFADTISTYLSSTKTAETTDTDKIENLSAGYYFVRDSAAPTLGTGAANSGAYTKYILQVVGNIEVTAKAAAPTVDKQVWDESDDAETGATDGWGESADHAINETFQFKLIATIPADTNLDAYTSYELDFEDVYSAGVTYEGLHDDSTTTTPQYAVKIGDTYIPEYDATNAPGGYQITHDTTNRKLTFKINDITDYLGTDGKLSAGATVTIVYDAHLNEDAIRDKASRADGTSANTNCNNVTLKYSNNPNTGNSLGETPVDYVWVYTYDINNIKYKDSVASGNELAGAEFQLLNGTTPIKLIDNADGTYTVADQTASLAAASGTTKAIVDKMISHTGDGKFDILGLDAGTYTLKETKAPTGYNTCPDTEIVIAATHAEDTASTCDLTLTNCKGMENTLVDTSGSKLPETGGIGTTLFYIGGGCMAGVAGILLITKKRAKNANN